MPISATKTHAALVYLPAFVSPQIQTCEYLRNCNPTKEDLSKPVFIQRPLIYNIVKLQEKGINWRAPIHAFSADHMENLFQQFIHCLRMLLNAGTGAVVFTRLLPSNGCFPGPLIIVVRSGITMESTVLYPR
jgi:hypothetical protein